MLLLRYTPGWPGTVFGGKWERGCGTLPSRVHPCLHQGAVHAEAWLGTPMTRHAALLDARWTHRGDDVGCKKKLCIRGGIRALSMSDQNWQWVGTGRHPVGCCLQSICTHARDLSSSSRLLGLAPRAPFLIQYRRGSSLLLVSFLELTMGRLVNQFRGGHKWEVKSLLKIYWRDFPKKTIFQCDIPTFHPKYYRKCEQLISFSFLSSHSRRFDL